MQLAKKLLPLPAYPLYEVENEPLPAIGAYSVILDSKGNAVYIIQTKKVTIVPFYEVSAEHAYKEGEGINP
ncbi:MAG: ASCH domain-containing protein [Mediterraneibacter gnavus]